MMKRKRKEEASEDPPPLAHFRPSDECYARSRSSNKMKASRMIAET